MPPPDFRPPLVACSVDQGDGRDQEEHRNHGSYRRVSEKCIQLRHATYAKHVHTAHTTYTVAHTVVRQFAHTSAYLLLRTLLSMLLPCIQRIKGMQAAHTRSKTRFGCSSSKATPSLLFYCRRRGHVFPATSLYFFVRFAQFGENSRASSEHVPAGDGDGEGGPGGGGRV